MAKYELSITPGPEEVGTVTYNGQVIEFRSNRITAIIGLAIKLDELDAPDGDYTASINGTVYTHGPSIRGVADLAKPPNYRKSALFKGAARQPKGSDLIITGAPH